MWRGVGARLDEDSEQVCRGGGHTQRHVRTAAEHQSPNLHSIPVTHLFVALSASQYTCVGGDAMMPRLLVLLS